MKIDPKIKEDLKDYLKKKLEEENEMVTIISPYKLEKEEMGLIYKKFPQYKDKKVKNIVKPEILGGIIIKQGTKIIDLSLKHKLQSLRKILYGNNR